MIPPNDPAAPRTGQETYGLRPVTDLYAQINDHRKAVREFGSPEVQATWDKIEEHIDIVYSRQVAR